PHSSSISAKLKSARAKATPVPALEQTGAETDGSERTPRQKEVETTCQRRLQLVLKSADYTPTITQETFGLSTGDILHTDQLGRYIAIASETEYKVVSIVQKKNTLTERQNLYETVESSDFKIKGVRLLGDKELPLLARLIRISPNKTGKSDAK